MTTPFPTPEGVAVAYEALNEAEYKALASTFAHTMCQSGTWSDGTIDITIKRNERYWLNRLFKDLKASGWEAKAFDDDGEETTTYFRAESIKLWPKAKDVLS